MNLNISKPDTNLNVSKPNNQAVGIITTSLLAVGLTFGAMNISSNDLVQQERIPIFTSIAESVSSDYKQSREEVEERQQATYNLENKQDSEKERQETQAEAIESSLDSVYTILFSLSILTGFFLFASGVFHIIRAVNSDGHISPATGWVMMFVGSTLSVFCVLFRSLFSLL